MKKILIVDDNINNRTVLRFLLEEYAREYENATFELFEAENGRDAVALAASESFDLILMDIMMPEMDGIKATKNIRRNNKEVMIIAVSAIDDEGRKKEILNAGAEDYISKPVNVDIFRSRINIYLSLIDSRRRSIYNAKAANLYTQEVYSRQMVFMVCNEDALSEFWEYYLLRDGEKCDNLSDVVRVLNAIGTLYINRGLTTRIIVEESEDLLFFTIKDVDKIEDDLIAAIMAKNAHVKEYKTDKKHMSFMLPQVSDSMCESVEPIPFVADAAPESVPQTQGKDASFLKTSRSHIRIYDYIEPEDLEELENYVGKLDLLFLVAGASDITEDEVSEIYTYLDRIGRMLTIYSESYRIGQAISILSQDIITHSETFRTNSVALAPMCAAFSRDLSAWTRMMFYEGSPSVDYMDDTIVANTQTISSMLKMDEAPADDGAGLDDIFDF